MDQDYQFEERADFLLEDDLISWTVQSPYFTKIQKQLINPGAKLLVGPRGSGKTHIMLHTYHYCVNNKSTPLPVYVSFGKYYHLEPLLTKTAHANKIFHCWILSKIFIGLYELLKMVKMEYDFLESTKLDKEGIEEFISLAEKGLYEEREEIDRVIRNISIDRTIDILSKATKKLNRKRTILLLDDAALSLTPEYLTEFFDVFRSLKTKTISPKASVYPGSTEYGPRFHVEQDASRIDVWKVDINYSEANSFMEEFYQKRLISDELQIPKDIRIIFEFASFGIPRAFLNLVNAYINSDLRSPQQKFNFVLEQKENLIKAEYLSLKDKLPQYESIITTGFSFFDKIKTDVVADNKASKIGKQLIFGIEKENDIQRKRLINFLIEAGMLYPFGEVKHGRIYERYIPHLLFLIGARAFSRNRGFNAKDILDFLARPDNKHPVRRKFETILNDKQLDNIKLDLPPCRNCGHKRMTENQKFCHDCGTELVSESRFEKCMKIKIEELPLSQWKINKITTETDIKTIGDLVTSPNPASELRKAYQIGLKRAQNIHSTATSYIEEFLS